ncbi:MAG: HNH endonuclease signature motif containing protein, partial [Candidatus Caldarchaeum sp.]
KGKAPKDPETGESMHVHHKKPLSEGGTNCPDNLEPMSPRKHRELHRERGDFTKWGKEGARRRKKR